jgi:hypothetical protein
MTEHRGFEMKEVLAGRWLVRASPETLLGRPASR